MAYSITQTLTGRTETTLTVSWASTEQTDYIWYSTNGGESWVAVGSVNGKSGNFVITSLSPNSPYTLQIRGRLKDTGQTVNSGVMTAITYSYPYCSNAPNFTIGEKLTLSFFNPLRRIISVNLIGADGSVIAIKSTDGLTVSGYDDEPTIAALYNSIPNSQSGGYQVEVICGGNSDTRTGGFYSVGSGSLPSMGNLTYSDINDATAAITGDNSVIIRNQSIIQFAAQALTGSTAATVTACAVSINGISYDLTLDGESATGGNVTIDSANDIDAVFTVTDSRGLSASRAIRVIMLDWELPSAIIELARQDNYYSETDITVNADYSSLNGANTIDIKCRYKKVTDGSYGADVTLQDEQTTTLTLDNNYAWNVQIVLTDLFGSTTYNAVVSVGMPIAFFDRRLSAVGFNCFPNAEKDVAANGRSLIKSCMTAELTTAISNVTQNTYTKIPLTLSASVGDKLTVTNDGGILVGAGVTVVMVSGRIHYNGAAVGNRALRIGKNSASDANCMAHVTSTASDGTLTISPTVVNVADGDIIYLYYLTATADSVPASLYGAQTCVTVETL